MDMPEREIKISEGIERVRSEYNSPLSSRNRLYRLYCSCPKVLIGDDDAFNILALNAMISSLSVSTDYVTDGSKALEKLKE